jgi:hypothetical protein
MPCRSQARTRSRSQERISLTSLPLPLTGMAVYSICKCSGGPDRVESPCIVLDLLSWLRDSRIPGRIVEAQDDALPVVLFT